VTRAKTTVLNWCKERLYIPLFICMNCQNNKDLFKKKSYSSIVCASGGCGLWFGRCGQLSWYSVHTTVYGRMRKKSENWTCFLSFSTCVIPHIKEYNTNNVQFRFYNTSHIQSGPIKCTHNLTWKILLYNRNYCIYTKSRFIWEMSLNFGFSVGVRSGHHLHPNTVEVAELLHELRSVMCPAW
jgi:hypothetical protein